MSEFSKKYLKICSIGLGVLALAVIIFVIVNSSGVKKEITLQETPIPSGEAVSETTTPVIMHETRELNTSAFRVDATAAPTNNVTFNENSHIAAPTDGPSAEPSASPVPDKTLSSYKYQCTLTITCADILSQASSDEKADIIPQNGFILEQTTVGFNENETVLDVLLRTLKEKKIHVDYSAGSGGTKYVKGIGNIYESDFGSTSGWIYVVNDTSPSVSCSEYRLENGDNIVWKYVR